MISVLLKYFEEKSGLALTEEEKRLIEAAFKPRKVLKRQYLHQEGDVARHLPFIVKGAARMFSVDDKGHEHIVRFGLEEWWIGDYESYTLQTPTKYHVEMVEDTDLLLAAREDMLRLIKAVPAVAETIKVMDKQSAIANQQRIHAAISCTAEERYEQLMNTYPDFIQRFPQNMIASYLGISPETLSRIKKNIVKR